MPLHHTPSSTPKSQNKYFTVLHGEHLVQSRQALTQRLAAATLAGQQVTRLEVKNLEPGQLTEHLGNQSLFGEPTLFVIEDLHSLPTSARKAALIKVLGTHAAANTEPAVILWEKRALTATMLKAFPGADVHLFKPANSMYAWLDGITGSPSPADRKAMLQKLKTSMNDHDPFFCFTMLVRQVRLLIEAYDGTLVGMPSFMVSKYTRQARTFSQEKLWHLHHQLLEIDLTQKTSRNPLTMAQELAVLLIQL